MTDKVEVGQEFCARVKDPGFKPDSLALWLDGLSHPERVQAIRGAGRKEQARLYEAVKGFAPLGLADIVPPNTPAGGTVRHHGKNTLPAFSHFEKRFCLPSGGDSQSPDRLNGFNFHSLGAITGPGYFVAFPNDAGDEVLVDYRQLPERQPDGWPEIRSNEKGLSRFVYGFMVDTLRRVSEHVSIGSAAREGKDLGSWFLLTREPG